MKKNKFAIIGLGFISERHIRAIENNDCELVVACDIDKTKAHKLPPKCAFVNNVHMLNEYDFNWLSICTPNYLHYHNIIDFADKNIICEKPLAINRSQIYSLYDIDKHKKNINVVQQLRYDKELQALKKKIDNEKTFYRVEMNIEVHRGDWYWQTWKGDDEKSGGILNNIGVHYFDLLVWLFGAGVSVKPANISEKSANGRLDFHKARVKWNLRLDAPVDNQKRQLLLNDKSINLNRNFEQLHTEVYKQSLIGKGIRVEDILPTLDLINTIYEISK